MTHDPVTGPLSREQLRALANAPAGAALQAIRKYDPLYGRAEGEMIEWVVECTGELTGHAYVKAASQEEADQRAADLTEADIDWDFGCGGDFEIVSVKPAQRHRGVPINQLEPLI